MNDVVVAFIDSKEDLKDRSRGKYQTKNNIKISPNNLIYKDVLMYPHLSSVYEDKI